MSEAVLRMKIVLVDTEPPIWRRVEVPAVTTLRQLHAVIQAAMGWDDDHLYQFSVSPSQRRTSEPIGTACFGG